MKHEDKCPVCGNDKYARILINQNSFIADRNGSVDVICCTNCGVMRVTQESLDFRKLCVMGSKLLVDKN